MEREAVGCIPGQHFRGMSQQCEASPVTAVLSLLVSCLTSRESSDPQHTPPHGPQAPAWGKGLGLEHQLAPFGTKAFPPDAELLICESFFVLCAEPTSSSLEMVQAGARRGERCSFEVFQIHERKSECLA